MRSEKKASGEFSSDFNALEEAGSFDGEAPAEGRWEAKDLVSMQIFLPRKKAVFMDEMRLRRMKKGQDLSRSQFLCEALELLAQKEAGSKTADKEGDTASR